MNKAMVVFLSDQGWSQVKIARRFNVTRSRICQIVNHFKRLSGPPRGVECEICNKPIKKKHYIRIGEIEPILVCKKCMEKSKLC